MSQPSPRTARISGGVDGEVIRATVAGDRIRTPPRAAAAEQHPAEARQIGGGAEQAGVSGDAVHPPRRRIVDDAAQERHVGPVARPRQRSRTLRSARFAARHDSGGRNVVSLHAERLEDVRLRVAIERLAADAAHDVAEQEEIDVAVDEPLAGRRRRHFVDARADRFVGAVKLDLELEVGPQPGRVRQQMADGDAALAVAAELRE